MQKGPALGAPEGAKPPEASQRAYHPDSMAAGSKDLASVAEGVFVNSAVVGKGNARFSR